jgi:hypothetical protein
VASHAEMKVAAIIREQHTRTGQAQHATIVINNLPCEGPFGCDELLPTMLPAGCSLTVHAPSYRRRFIGGTQR